LLAQAKRDDDLPLRREPYGFELLSRTHVSKYDIAYKVRQYIRSKIIALWEESRSNTKRSLQERDSADGGWSIFVPRRLGHYERKSESPEIDSGLPH
jgi:hypothetical protein